MRYPLKAKDDDLAKAEEARERESRLIREIEDGDIGKGEEED